MRVDDRLGVADREIIRGLAAGALAVGVEQRREAGLVRPAEAERDAGAVMVVVDRAALLGRRPAGSRRPPRRPASGVSGPACQPVPKRAVRRIAASDEPPIHIGRSGCTGFGAIDAPDKVIMHALEIDLVLASTAGGSPRAPRRSCGRGSWCRG